MPLAGESARLMKVVIVSGIQVTNNPRVVKEATALSEAGFDVVVIGAVLDEESIPKIQRILDTVGWRHLPVVDLSSQKASQKLRFLIARVRWKFWCSTRRLFNLEFPGQLGYFPGRLYRLARGQDADLYIVHLEQALWVGQKLIQDGCRVAADFEDWYSEDCLPADNVERPVRLIRRYERFLLQRCAYSTTTSKALAETLAATYHCAKPTVVYNSFPTEDRVTIDRQVKDRRNVDIPSITWFSQTIGPGRGLEQLIAALKEISLPFELHIRGTARPGYREALIEDLSASKKQNLYFHEQVPQQELLSRLSEHDIGYCGESSYPLSRDLTITNKLLEYLRAGLAVVASNTTGQLEVAQVVPDGVRVFTLSDPSSLVSVLSESLADPSLLDRAKEASRCGLERYFDWSESERSLVELACSALDVLPPNVR